MSKGQDGKNVDDNSIPAKINSLGRELNYTSGACNRLVQTLLDPYDLPMIYWVILTALWRRGQLSVTQIAQYYNVKPPAASRLLGRMERDGWVKVTHGTKDKRNKFYATTQKAKDTEHLLSIIQTVNTQLTIGFSEHEVVQFKDFLERIQKNAQHGCTKDWAEK